MKRDSDFLPFDFLDDLLRAMAMDQETMRALAMQRVRQLILNPESRSLTVFPLPGMMSSGCSTQSIQSFHNLGFRPAVLPTVVILSVRITVSIGSTSFYLPLLLIHRP